MHLDAAVVLFKQKQIFQYHRKNESSASSPMSWRRWAMIPLSLLLSSPTLWNADQAVFRFFSAMLLVDDIVSSTSLASRPRLREYHAHLLTTDLKPELEVPLQLEDFIGCQSWALLLAGEIAALDAWKKEMKKDGALPTTQLVQRASMIRRRLYALTCLTTDSITAPAPPGRLMYSQSTSYVAIRQVRRMTASPSLASGPPLLSCTFSLSSPVGSRALWRSATALPG
jgi:hypothetical protein